MVNWLMEAKVAEEITLNSTFIGVPDEGGGGEEGVAAPDPC